MTCEVLNLFAHLVPKEGLNRMERERARQALVPDFQLAMSDRIQGIQRLAELKVVNCCSSQYQVDERQKGVDKRARLLSSEYRRKARNVDKEYVGTPEGEVVSRSNRKTSGRIWGPLGSCGWVLE